ncbi:iron chaperone [Nocardioides sp.]|uniref:iron chaperone n=1 Tax=Nocardioides sp. TaxID=35761 RepID=UPI0039E3217A
MPAPKVASVEDYFARLGEVEAPHLERLRELSLAGAAGTGVEEALRFNTPAYVKGAPKPAMVWMLQCFKNHCSIRFPVPFFGAFRDEAAAAGYDAIQGALKIRWDQEVPEALVARLIAARIEDFDAGNTAWSVPGQYDGKKK